MEGFYKTCFHRKGVAWFQWFVPSALKNFIRARNPAVVPSEKEQRAERDRGLQYLVSKYKMDAQDRFGSALRIPLGLPCASLLTCPAHPYRQEGCAGPVWICPAHLFGPALRIPFDLPCTSM